ncbi:1d72747b-ff92-4ff8-80fe-a503ea0c23e8 [Thermothielavioides terrestris]|uniref:1d72747b-ff92-4ff8-80fe-a503ea0c23e8 n=1 Tax=Thermothielavioides terrestris TaxID=2587410 RepID=A0A3S4AKW3_9PEZI|nr:1d72747b-ff92-4ff8-80fe-a503ea0c23e8 [Thermothielavioides terrestris]
MADAVETELAGTGASVIVVAPSSQNAPSPQQERHQPQQQQQPQPQPQQRAPDAAKDPAEPIFPLLHNNAGADADSVTSGASGPSRAAGGVGEDNDEDEPAVARPFHRTSSPDVPSRPGLGKTVEDADDDEGRGGGATCAGNGLPRPRLKQQMHRFSLYETASRFYIVGGDVTEKRYRILKIDRTNEDASELSITDDKTVYSQKDMNQLLDTIDDGNKGTGGLKLRCTTWGLLGFIKFTGPYYMLLITKKSTVAMIGGHYVYQIDGTDLIPLTSPNFKMDQRNTEESRFLSILNNLDLTRSFYYSYSYDITRTLQHNIARERTALLSGRPCSADDDFNPMFVWNHHLLQPAAKVLNAPFDWCRPIIHGYIDQAAVSVYGRTAHITVIARRSRFFAGARFLKRGANDLGYVANDVETEQIVSEAMTTSFHAPGPRFFASPTYTSYVQHRGSIPLYWTQDNTGVTPKPPIELNLVDPFYTAAALHFDNLFERYGAPIYVLNLIKARERTPRESKLLDEYTRAIAYLNQFLPADKKIIYRAWDMSRAAKSRDQDVIGTLETIAEDVVRTTGFFQNGDGHTTPIRVQNGVARTNCIDCLDRTNAAQFVIGKRALGYQLHALGILGETTVEYDTDAVNLFTHMWHDHGDTIAVQYGGSQLVNTMETYRKINQWTSHSRDMIESFKRYYNNSFLDGQRQEAYNLFLGNYIFAQGQPMLWDLATDYYLHHEDPRTWLEKRKRDYINWYTPEFLEPRVLPPYPAIKPAATRKPISAYDDYWLEYYRPSTLSSFPKMFPYKMNSTIKYIPFKSTLDGRYDLSPFRVRTETDGDAQEKRKAKKEVSIVAPQDLARLADDTETSSVSEKPSSPTPSATAGHHSRSMSLHRWLHEKQQGPNGTSHHSNNHHHSGHHQRHSSLTDEPASPFASAPPSHQHHPPPSHPEHHYHHHHDHHSHHHHPHSQHPQYQQQQHPLPRSTTAAAADKPHKTALEKSRAAQWTFAQVVHDSLNPSVSAAEAADYARYVAHPHNLPLVVSSDLLPAEADAVEPEYVRFVHGRWRVEGLGSLPEWEAGGNSTTAPHGSWGEAEREEGDRALYVETVRVAENPLTVTEEDALKKRYKAYRKWLRGKSLFKQQPVD